MKKLVTWVLLVVMMVMGVALAKDFTPSPKLENVLGMIVYTVDKDTGVRTIEEAMDKAAVVAVTDELANLVGQGKSLKQLLDEASCESIASVLPEDTALDNIRLNQLASARITFYDKTKDIEEIRIAYSEKYPQESVLACVIGVLKASDAENQDKRIALPGCESADWIVAPAGVAENGDVIVYLDRAAQKFIDKKDAVFTVLETK